MRPNPTLVLAGLSSLLLTAGIAAVPAGAEEGEPTFTPGAAGAGDRYFPLDGNGGYDTRHYTLKVRYTPATNVLVGEATIEAETTQNLSTFNLDLDGLTVRSVEVDKRPAVWSRAGGELTIRPAKGIKEGREFVVRIRYDGVPRTLNSPLVGRSGFIHTDDGALVVGEPHVASTWYPVNDHPSDKAAYTFHITVPEDVEAVANGELEDVDSEDGWTTWSWEAEEPMASYLTTATVGQFRLNEYRIGDVEFLDAVDTDLYTPTAAPRTGSRFAISQATEDFRASYKRLTRQIRVPRSGGRLTFWVVRDTEPDSDFLIVEAHTVGRGDWTTLRDRNGHSHRFADNCPGMLRTHPFLRHYITLERGRCLPRGTTGAWHGADGSSRGYEKWRVNLDQWAGKRVEVSISYVSDAFRQGDGLFVDDITGPAGRGSTSFEADGNMLDGWVVRRAPRGSPRNPNNWIIGTVADTPPTLGEMVDATFARHGDFLEFLEARFGEYPFETAGGIVDDERIFFALENQTRPIYSPLFWEQAGPLSDLVVVHELAHQWYGDSLTVARWRHIWLNEGFATYAEWLWLENQGIVTADRIFRNLYRLIPAESEFWRLRIGNPGPDRLFDFPVFDRGAMTLHVLRRTVGDEVFFQLLQEWADRYEGRNVTTWQFIALAEELSARQLDELFRQWLFTARKPTLTAAAAALSQRSAATGPAPSAVGSVERRLGGTKR